MQRACTTLVLLLLLGNCPVKAGLPRAIPSDFLVKVTEGQQTEIPFLQVFQVRADSIHYRVQEEGFERTLALPTPQGAIHFLYQRLKQLHATQIRSRPSGQTVFGQPMASLEIMAGGKKSLAVRSGQTMILHRWESRFNEALFAVKDFVARQVRRNEQEVQLEITYSHDLLALSEFNFCLGQNFRERWRIIEARSLPQNFSFKALPGNYRLVGSMKLGDQIVDFTQVVQVTEAPCKIKLRLGPEGLEPFNP
jgi:hypothetical protein